MLIRLVSVLLSISFLMEALADLRHLLFSLLLIGNFLYCVGYVTRYWMEIVESKFSLVVLRSL